MKIQKIPEFCLAIAFRKFPINLGIFWKILEFSKIEKRYSLYYSRNLYEIFKILLKNPKLILEIPRFSRKFQDLSENFEMQLPSRILVFLEFSIKPHLKKEFAFINTIAIKQGIWFWFHTRWIIQRCKDRGKILKKTWWKF